MQPLAAQGPTATDTAEPHHNDQRCELRRMTSATGWETRFEKKRNRQVDGSFFNLKKLVPPTGIEPVTVGLQNRCSATELQGRQSNILKRIEPKKLEENLFDSL